MDLESTGGERRGLSSGIQPDSAEALARFNEELDLVDLIARQIRKSIGRAVEFDDLLSAGREGLLDAARRFDASRKIPFRAYANVRIRGAMIDGVRGMSALPRRAYERLLAMEGANQVDEGQLELTLANSSMMPGEAEAAFADQLALVATTLALGNVAQFVEGKTGEVASLDSTTPEDELSRAQLLARAAEVLNEFKEAREATVLRLVYFEGMTLEAIAQDFGVDKSWVSRLHTRGLDRLIKRMRNLI